MDLFLNNSSIIKTTPKFTADLKGKYGWLNNGIYVGNLEEGKTPNSVSSKIYKML